MRRKIHIVCVPTLLQLVVNVVQELEHGGRPVRVPIAQTMSVDDVFGRDESPDSIRSRLPITAYSAVLRD
jgi:hypothetical protein